MLNKEFRDEVINKSINCYGEKQSLNQTLEELGELIVEVSKNIRGFDNRKNVIEEMADVIICFQYLKTLLDISVTDIEEMMDYKLKRLNIRMRG